MEYVGRERSSEKVAFANILNPNWVAAHRGALADYLKRYRMHAAEAASMKLDGLKLLAPSLLGFISDERTLFAAWQHMATHGGSAPGPDGDTYGDFTTTEVWDWCRATRDGIRSDQYTPGEESVVRIPKTGDRGFRELVLQSIFDRVVHRAVVEITQALLDPLFDRRSFGYRPKKGPLRALAAAERLYKGGKRGVWVSVDIRNAFPSVPVGRLLGVVQKYFPDDRFLTFIKTVTISGKRLGLRQGSPLSPLLLNLYLHHVLDRKWRESHPEIPLLRFADDILLMCRTEKQARDAYAALTKYIRDAGFELKETCDDAIKGVAKGELVDWMGFGIRGAGGGLSFKVTDDAWDSLQEALVSAHGKPNSPIAAFRSIAGWVADKGPCYPHTHFDRAYDRIERMATAQGFAEILDRDELKGLWQRAYARWGKLRANVGR